MNLAWAKKKVASMAKAILGAPMNLTDNVAKGYLSVYKGYSDGSRETVFENDPNTITFASREHHLKFLHDPAVAQDVLASFKVGSGGAIGSDTAGNTNIKVISPDPTRNDLYTPIPLVNDEISIVPSPTGDYSDGVYISIQFTLSQDEGNGLFINECALFKDGGDMFNHKTFISIPKNESFTLIFDWRIIYV